MNVPPVEKRGLLEAPASFWTLTSKRKEKICNGGGPKGWGWLVPDTMWGLRLTDCFNIHDYDYYIKTKKKVADKRMYSNLRARINHRGGSFRWLRLCRAWTYYKAVSRGGAAFY